MFRIHGILRFAQDKVKKVHKFILDILFPIECLGCKKDDVWLCDECFKQFKINTQALQKLELIPSYLDGFLIATDWENKILQDAIHKFKYNFSQELADVLSKIIIQKVERMNLQNFLREQCLLVPVPLHKKRFAWRGFNQAELLAKKIAEEFDIELNTKIISRIKNTSPQVKLSGEQRGENILNAFQINKYNSDKNILLIDDIITTGATMNECAKVLKNSGAKKIFGLAIARG